MNKLEDFIIDAPYQKTEEDRACIAAVSPRVNRKEDWEDKCLNEFKSNLRDYLWDKQNGRCAYCRIRIHDSEASPEIEHIVPKDKKADWMYEPFNLCLSCKMCNTKKGHTKRIVVDESVTQLPMDSDSYLLIHPYLDRYSEHIELVEDVLYKGLTEKGRYTIDLCKLNRFQLAAARADEKIRQESSAYAKLMLTLVNVEHKTLVDNIDKFIKRIKECIDEYKEINRLN